MMVVMVMMMMMIACLPDITVKVGNKKVTKINKINKNGAYFNLFYCTTVALLIFYQYIDIDTDPDVS